MNKKLVATLASVCLVAALGVGATLAYYTAETGEVKNTFTIGNVDIDVVEPDWDPDEGKDLVPGAEVDKNPIIVNTGASAGYMMLQVTGMDDMAKLGFSVKYEIKDEDGNVVESYDRYNTADWTLVDADGNKLQSDGTLVDGYYVYKEAVAEGASTSSLFTSVVLADSAKESTETLYMVVGEIVYDANGDVVMKDGAPQVEYYIEGVEAEGEPFATYALAEEYVMNNYGEKASFVFDLKVKGYAIQSENLEYQTAGVYTWVDDLTGGTPKTADAE